MAPFKPVITRIPFIMGRYGTPDGSVMISPYQAKLGMVGKSGHHLLRV
jgi:hypothetical protein